MAEQDQVHNTSAVFSAFDRNKDGRLSFSDLRLGFQNMGVVINDEELKEMMNEVLIHSYKCG